MFNAATETTLGLGEAEDDGAGVLLAVVVFRLTATIPRICPGAGTTLIVFIKGRCANEFLSGDETGTKVVSLEADEQGLGRICRYGFGSD